MEIIIIAAMASNRVIGLNNSIPWHIPEELALFKKTTTGHAVIMGRKTYESIGLPLPDRKNIILSQNELLEIDDCQIAHDLREALNLCVGQDKIFIIGGESVFKESLEIADTILLTTLHREVEGDIFFPELPPQTFMEVDSITHDASEPFTLTTYERIHA